MKRAVFFLMFSMLFFLGCSTDEITQNDQLEANDPEMEVLSKKNGNNRNNFKQWSWEEVNNNASWSARAGLQVLNHQNQFFLIGGRTPLDPDTLPFVIPGASKIWGDVWKSENYGDTWGEILQSDNNTDWPARAYFQAVSKGDFMYILGGQNFNDFFQSEFFNDVWRSKDGVSWDMVTQDAGWDGRAGLSAVVFNDEIYVMGGSFNNDVAIIPGEEPEAPERIYYNDVWKSVDGTHWDRVIEHAPWAPRAGGVAVVKDGYMYMIGGEDGFTCEDSPRCPPYYNDVWRTQNGLDWELVNASCAWSARPGHQVVVAQNRFVLFGGFGLGPLDGLTHANPMDVWISNNGKVWKNVSNSPWNATNPSEIKYDFDAVVVEGEKNKSDMIFSFGGDRETFNFFDSFNYLNVDNDVWKFSYEK